jgi:hypothetical protein
MTALNTASTLRWKGVGGTAILALWLAVSTTWGQGWPPMTTALTPYNGAELR